MKIVLRDAQVHVAQSLSKITLEKKKPLMPIFETMDVEVFIVGNCCLAVGLECTWLLPLKPDWNGAGDGRMEILLTWQVTGILELSL